MIWTDTPTRLAREAVQRATHAVRPIVEVRIPETDSNEDEFWNELQVVEATVTFGDPATLPTRTISATVLLETEDGSDVLADDLLSPYGSWIRAYQEVTELTGARWRVPYGYFRMDSYTVDHLTGSISFQGTDISAFVADLELLTLGEGRITTKQDYLKRLEAALVVATDDLVPVWGDLFAANGKDYELSPKGAWHVTGSRIDFVQKVAARFQQYIVCPTHGAAFQLQDYAGTGDSVTIKGGDIDSTLVGEIVDTVDRQDMANIVSATYSYEVALGGGVMQQVNRRVVVEYNDTNATFRATGPFGRVSRDGLSADLLKGMTAAEARQYVTDQAIAAIGGSIKKARDVTFTAGPFYGIEVGDQVSLVPRIHETAAIRGRLVGLTVPLHADGGAWSYTIRPVKVFDASWKPRTYYDTTESKDKPEDRADFHDYNVKTVAMEDKFPNDANGNGWHVTGQHDDVPYPASDHTKGHKNKLKVKGVAGGDTLKIVAKGGVDVVAYTDKAWSIRHPTLRRFQVKASVRANDHAGNVRLGIDYTPGGIVWTNKPEYVHIPKKKTRSLTMDVVLPASATDFGLRIEVDNPPTSSLWTVNSIAVEEAFRVTS